MTDKLTDVIDEMVRNKTFSLDALDAVKGLRDRAIEQDRQIERLNSLLETRGESEARLRAENSTLQRTIEDHAKNESSLREREGKVLALELAEARSTATAGALREAFGIVFKNTTVRESVQRSTAVAVPGTASQMGFPTTVPEHSTVERTVE